MKEDDFHLERIICIDSYRKGDIVEVRVDGHTNLNGANAAGKTTLLRLIPLFYGEAPSRMSRGENGKEGFAEHYLPRSTSYIVFEYARRGSLCMAVLHSDSRGQSVQYRFVSSGYRKDLFIEEGRIVQSGGEIRRHIEKQQLECTGAFGLNEYLSIIQNDAPRREPKLKSLAARYAFVGAGQRISNIQRIVTGMFSRQTTFQGLKQIIIDSIRPTDAGQGQGDHTMKLSTNREALLQWSRDHDAYAEVMKEASRFESAVQNKREYEQAIRRLRQIKGHLIALSKHHEGKKKDALEQIDAIKAELQGIRESHENKRSKVLEDRARASGEAEAAKTHIQALDDQHEEYARQGIADRAAQLAKRPVLQREYEQAQGELEALTGSQKDVQAQYDRLVEGASQVAGEQITALEQSKGKVHETHAARSDAHRTHFASRISEQRLAHENERIEIQRDLDASIARVAEFKARVEMVQASPDLIDAEEAKRNEISQAEVRRELARKDLGAAGAKEQEQRRAYQGADEQLRRIESRVADKRQALQASREMAEGKPGTVLHFLRSSMPGWQENIGRVLSRETLLREDLDPQIDPAQAKSLYGVSLDLERIEPPWYVADEAALAERIAEQESELAKEVAAETRQRELLQTHKSSLEQAQQEHALAQGEYEDATGVCTKLEEERQSLQKQIKESRARAQKQAKESHDEAILEHKGIEAEMKALNGRQKAEQAQLDKESVQALEALRLERERALAQIDAQVAALKEDLNAKITQINAEREQSLAEKGISATTLARLNKTIKELGAQLKRIADDTPAIQSYQGWLSSQWPQRARFQAKYEEARKQAERLECEDREIQASLADQTKKLSSQIETKEKEGAENDTKINAALVRINALSAYREDEHAALATHDIARTINLLTEQTNEARAILDRTQTRIREDINLIIRAFKKQRDSQPDKFYEQCRQQLTDLENQEHKWVELLEQWFGGRHEEARDVLRIGADVLGNQITGFHRSLINFSAAIRAFGRELQHCIDGSVDFDKITNMQVNVSSSVTELPFWNGLGALSEEFRVWKDAGGAELPHEEFCRSLRELAAFFEGQNALSTDPVDLVSLEIELTENGRKTTVRNERALENVSSNGLSYLILVVVFLGFLQRVRADAPVQVLCAVDELKNIDLANTERLFDLLDRHRVTLISAFPDADAEVLRLFDHRYTLQEGRRLARVVLEEDLMDEQDEDLTLESSHV